ncbi:carboxylesterase/lipase family protein [Polaribacter tangerinus]|uniref:carboxylesterase/lipase family protein n=1 Tax=Polaribacter tangerinus TaxID=1920034 RepID=UPI000B4A8A40|nr:carboxylesterase family protein [Polaribacter tangerinus]
MLKFSSKYQFVKYFFLFLTMNGSLIYGQQEIVDTPLVKIESGFLKGELKDAKNNLVVFKGIPYAKPPVGDLRWRAPQKEDKWEGVKVCDSPGPICPQRVNGSGIQNMSEDCLYLNIFSTNLNNEKKVPVMVWIHGGGLNMGTGIRENSDGSEFAKKGVVLVSLNYRLGQLGFLAHPELSAESENGVSGNYGILDQILALKWIKKNISKFGGDPENVTIFGESAGGTCVSVLCSSKQSKGLFHKAILQSPWMFGFMSNTAKPNITYLKKGIANIPSAESLGLNWSKKYLTKKDTNTLKKLRALDAKLITRDEPYYETRITVDGWLLEDFQESVFMKGNQADVPIIIGTNKDEGNYYWNFIKQKTISDITKSLESFYASRAEHISEFYFTNSYKSVKLAVSRYITDAWFLEPSLHLLKGMDNVSSQVYQYRFSVPNRKYPKLGAVHGAEIKYVFNNLNDTFKKKDYKVAENMISYWVQFAKTGNPNKKGLNTWEPYDSKKNNFLDFTEMKSKIRNINAESQNQINQLRILKVKAYLK